MTCGCVLTGGEESVGDAAAAAASSRAVNLKPVQVMFRQELVFVGISARLVFPSHFTTYGEVRENSRQFYNKV